MRRPALLLASVVLLAFRGTPVVAGTTLPGVYLRWDHCFGDGGVANKTFACDTNSGTERLVGSFELAAPLGGVSSLEIHVDLMPSSTTLPAWWGLKNAGTCRQLSLQNAGALPAGSSNCLDWAGGNATSVIFAYTEFIDPQSRTIEGLAAVSSENILALDSGREYFAFNYAVTHAKTVGTGACGGCDTPVCFVFSSLSIGTSGSFSVLLQGADGEASREMTWQGAVVGAVANIHNTLGWFSRFTCSETSTPTLNRTWGAVKALYR